MSTDRGVDEEDVVQIHNGILLGLKKEQNNAICSNMDGPRDYYNKWSQKDKDKYYEITNKWNLKKKKVQTDYKISKPNLRLPKGRGWTGRLGLAQTHSYILNGMVIGEIYPTLCDSLYEDRIRKRMDIYAYGWFTLLYTWYQPNIVSQLCFDENSFNGSIKRPLSHIIKLFTPYSSFPTSVTIML